MKSIWARTLVKNEERYLWYAVSSIVDFVDKVLLWDTGSTDNTVKIIKNLQESYPGKILFKEVGEVDPDGFTRVSQEMLEETKSDWFIIVDGDEVWWEEGIKQMVEDIHKNGDRLESYVVKMRYPVGDIYHYQEEKAGNYEIDGKRGHFNIRAINQKIPGLHFEKPHGMIGIIDKDGVLIQNREPKLRKHLDIEYMHFSYLPRSGARVGDLAVPKRKMKYKHEIGNPFPKDYYYPEVFFRPRPKIVPSVWNKMEGGFMTRALLETPLRWGKRRLFKSRVGY